MQQLFERLGDLVRHALLDAEPPGEHAHQAGQLADADDLIVGHVAHVGLAEERQRVVLAQREERDRALDDLGQLAAGVAVALGREDGH